MNKVYTQEAVDKLVHALQELDEISATPKDGCTCESCRTARIIAEALDFVLPKLPESAPGSTATQDHPESDLSEMPDCTGADTRNGMDEWQAAQNEKMRDAKDWAAEAFNKYREGRWGAYDPYPIDAFTHFCAGFEAARALSLTNGER